MTNSSGVNQADSDVGKSGASGIKRLAIHITIILLVGVIGGTLLRAVVHGPQRVWREVQAAVGLKQGVDAPPETESVNVSNHVDPPPANLPDILKEFTLTERSGKTVSSEDLRGEPYLVSFFFSTCPSVCVMQNQALQKLQQEFRGKPVKFLSITVDPETDTPETLREYALRFGADPEQWLFLTGDLTYIRRVSGEIYALAADKAFHSEKFVLVDRDGKIIDRFSWRDEKQMERLKRELAEEFDALAANSRDDQ